MSWFQLWSMPRQPLSITWQRKLNLMFVFVCMPLALTQKSQNRMRHIALSQVSSNTLDISHLFKLILAACRAQSCVWCFVVTFGRSLYAFKLLWSFSWRVCTPSILDALIGEWRSVQCRCAKLMWSQKPNAWNQKLQNIHMGSRPKCCSGNVLWIWYLFCFRLFGRTDTLKWKHFTQNKFIHNNCKILKYYLCARPRWGLFEWMVLSKCTQFKSCIYLGSSHSWTHLKWNMWNDFCDAVKSKWTHCLGLDQNAFKFTATDFFFQVHIRHRYVVTNFVNQKIHSGWKNWAKH